MREPRVCLQDAHHHQHQAKAKAKDGRPDGVEEMKLALVTVAVFCVWAGVGWTATSRDGIATGECISIV